MRVKVRRGKWQPPVTADKPKRVGRKRRKYPMFSELPIGAPFCVSFTPGGVHDRCVKTARELYVVLEERTGELYEQKVDLSRSGSDFPVMRIVYQGEAHVEEDYSDLGDEEADDTFEDL